MSCAPTDLSRISGATDRPHTMGQPRVKDSQLAIGGRHQLHQVPQLKPTGWLEDLPEAA